MMTANPCHHCPDRDPYCHGRCQKYNDWKAIHEAEKAAMARDSERHTLTYAQKKALWAARRRKQYVGCTKKFSG